MELPKSLSDKHPEFIQINHAIQEWENGQPITVLCPTCDDMLIVDYVEAVRTLWVTCPNGCTNYHENRAMNDE